MAGAAPLLRRTGAAIGRPAPAPAVTTPRCVSWRRSHTAACSAGSLCLLEELIRRPARPGSLSAGLQMSNSDSTKLVPLRDASTRKCRCKDRAVQTGEFPISVTP